MVGGEAPLWSIERSSRRRGRNPPVIFYSNIYTYTLFRMSVMLEKALSGLGLGASEGTAEMKVGGSKGGPGKSRCKRGSRRNKAGDCVRVAGYTAKKRCPRGTRRSKVTGSCEKLETMVKKVAKEALVEVAELKKADAAVKAAGVDRLAAARAAAALKRQKKSASKTARVQGKIAAAEAREKKAADFEEDRRKEREIVLAKIEKARKAMGIRKNEENPVALRHLIEDWQTESNVRLFNKRG